MKRTLIIAIGAFLVVSMIGFYVLYKSLDVIIETAIEKYGSEITQAELRLAGVTIDPANGRSVLKGLKLGSPVGFSADYAAQIDEISVVFDIDTFTRDVIVIKEIRITQPVVTYEIGTKGSNIDALQRNIDAYAEAGGSGEKVTKTDASAGQKLVIDNLYISDGKINISAAGLKGEGLSAVLPNIHLTGIGRKTGGATAGEVAKIIIASLSRGVGKGVTVLKLDDVIGTFNGKARGVTDIIRKSAGDRRTKDVGKAMEGLFK